MIVTPVDTATTFGYHHPLKTLYKKGKLPTVKYGFYGDTLSAKSVSLEHLLPRSKGGKSVLSNYVLASKANNTKRGNDDIHQHFKPKAAMRYLDQFVGVKQKGFDGNKYVQMILTTLDKLGIDIGFYSR